MAEVGATGMARPSGGAGRRPLLLVALLAAAALATFVLAALPGRLGLIEGLFLAGLGLLGLVYLLIEARRTPSAAAGRALSGAALPALLDQSVEAVACTSPEGQLLFANERYRRLAGARRTEGPLGAFAASDASAATLYRLLRGLMETPRTEAVMALADEGGTPRPYRVSVERLSPDAAGLGAALLWRFLPGGTEERALLDLRATRDGEGRALEAAGLARLTLSAEGRVLGAEGAVDALFGRPAGDLADRRPPLAELVGARDVAAPPGRRLDVEGRDGRPLWLAAGAPAGETLTVLVGRRDRALAGADEGAALLAAARIVDEAPVGIVLVDEAGLIVEANRTFRRLTAAGEGTFPALIDLVQPTDREDLVRRLALQDPPAEPFELRFAGDVERTTQVFLTRLSAAGGERTLSLLYVLDTTTQKNLELQFAQSQKMQAVGQLAGGIAHDFNNILTAVLGFCDLLLTRHPAGDPSFPDIEQIRQNATRAAGLVRQLLAFSRQQTLMPKVLWLPDALSELKPLLLRLVGEKVQLEIKHDRDLGLVRVDEVQLGQVIMNLAVNARDAMPDGGKLAIRTANVSRAESVALGHELMPPMDYVLIEVADTGCGIATEFLGKIFEPFFTTKEVGQGTGLGLSTVYGIVKQTNGFIFPESALGHGTTFRIYLPRHSEEAPVRPAVTEEAERPSDHTGRGTILIVEDEEAVRAFASRALASRGYTVFEAESGEAALELMRRAGETIDLVISDVIMPAMDGPTLVRAVRAEWPRTRVILISGYAEDAFRRELGRDGSFAFLPKPFVLKQLIQKVKEVMAA